jgi:hypothetical protein
MSETASYEVNRVAELLERIYENASADSLGFLPANGPLLVRRLLSGDGFEAILRNELAHALHV